MTFRKTPPHFLFTIVLGFAACDRGTSPRNSPQSAPPKISTYEGHGVLREVSADGRKAIIAHEAIPDYMEAMTMEFDVRDSTLSKEVEPGDRVAFRLSVTETQSWIDQVRKLGGTASSRPEVTPLSTSNVTLLQSGAPLPDCALIDQRGQPFRLSDFKGHALAITFIFTRCPLPNFCPLMNQHFATLQRELKTGSASSNWHLVSISLDPEYDTPERMNAYAEPYNPDAEHWKFATGDAEEIRKFGAAFGLATIRNGVQIDHNLRTVVVDATGRVRRIFTGNDWQTDELIEEVRRAIAGAP